MIGYPYRPVLFKGGAMAVRKASKATPVAGRRDAGRPRGATVVDAVMAATLDELAAVGIEGLSIDRIARNTSLNKTSIYRRWPTREALVAAALERILESAGAHAPDTGSLRGDLIALLTPVIMMMDQPTGRALLRAAFAAGSAANVAALAARAFDSRGATPIHAMIQRATARGEWREGVSGHQLTTMLVGAAMHRAMLEHAPLTASWLESAIDLTLFGALPRSGTT
jgi:AcrR family transcriptional regulator